METVTSKRNLVRDTCMIPNVDKNFTFGAAEEPANIPMVAADQTSLPERHTKQSNVVIKRDDSMYRTLNTINTVVNVCGVLLIAAVFVTVCYGAIMMSEVVTNIEIIRNQGR